MFFLNRVELDKRFRQLRLELERLGGISEELRGWSWERPPVEPPLKNVLLGVSELAARYCSTLRDIYLNRILGIKPPLSSKMFVGKLLHETATQGITMIKSLLYSKGILCGSELVQELLPRAGGMVDQLISELESQLGKLAQEELIQAKIKGTNFYRFLVIQAAAAIDIVLAKHPHLGVDDLVGISIPPITERKLDGSLVGLSRNLSVDLYSPAYALMDLKTGELRDFHVYAPTGYALALEAAEEIPVNFGLIIYVGFHPQYSIPLLKLKHFIISDELRREFLEIRDEAFEIIEHARDPGKPSKCPDYCPYHPVCPR